MLPFLIRRSDDSVDITWSQQHDIIDLNGKAVKISPDKDI